MMYSDDGGRSWQLSPGNNSDFTGYVHRIRPTPTASPKMTVRNSSRQIAVDEATGSVVVSMYDTRYDSSRACAAMVVVASNDGGQTFSAVSFANQPRSAIDAATGKTVTIEPIPDNQSAGNPNTDTSTAFGDRQGLAVLGGKIYPVWSGNLNGTTSLVDGNNSYGNNRLEIMTNVLTIPAGPRVVSSTMGAVGEPTDTLNNTRPRMAALRPRALSSPSTGPFRPSPPATSPSPIATPAATLSAASSRPSPRLPRSIRFSRPMIFSIPRACSVRLSSRSTSRPAVRREPTATPSARTSPTTSAPNTWS